MGDRGEVTKEGGRGGSGRDGTGICLLSNGAGMERWMDGWRATRHGRGEEW